MALTRFSMMESELWMPSLSSLTLSFSRSRFWISIAQIWKSSYQLHLVLCCTSTSCQVLGQATHRARRRVCETWRSLKSLFPPRWQDKTDVQNLQSTQLIQARWKLDPIAWSPSGSTMHQSVTFCWKKNYFGENFLTNNKNQLTFHTGSVKPLRARLS